MVTSPFKAPPVVGAEVAGTEVAGAEVAGAGVGVACGAHAARASDETSARLVAFQSLFVIK